MLVLSGGSLDAERATCFSAGRRQGVARRASNFLSLRRKKVTKERATLLCVSLRCATGNLRCSVRGCAAELTARCALRSNNCGKSVHEVRVSFGTRTHPLPCASRHAQKGTPNGHIHTGHCFAALRSAPSRGRKRHALRRRGRAQRWPEWMLAVRLSHPCWLRLRRGGCGVAWASKRPCFVI